MVGEMLISDGGANSANSCCNAINISQERQQHMQLLQTGCRVSQHPATHSLQLIQLECNSHSHQQAADLVLPQGVSAAAYKKPPSDARY